MTSEDPVAVSKDIADRARDAAVRAANGLGDVAASATDRAHEAAGKVSEKASDVYQRVRDGASDLGDRIPNASEAIDASRRAYDRGSRHVARHVGRQPIEALLLAGAIGYLVGWAANRS